MLTLAVASAFFLAIHLLVSGTRLRDAIAGTIGEQAYLAAFSIASAVGIVWLALSFNSATSLGSQVLWDFGPGVRHLGILLIAIAFLLAVPGLLTPNPTSVGMEKLVTKSLPVTGVLRITRHPFLWGVAIWSAFHLLANGDAASVLFFGTFLVLAISGTFSIDAKRKRKWGVAWEGFASTTSNIPFVAILTGRNTLILTELLTYRQILAVLVFGLVLLTHAWAFGASPFPGGWVPF